VSLDQADDGLPDEIHAMDAGEASTRSAAQDFDQKVFPLPPATQTEISRSRSLGDKSPKPREKTMKIRAVVILVGLVISFAFAQEKEDVKPFPFTPIPAGPQLVLGFTCSAESTEFPLALSSLVVGPTEQKVFKR
jgi:hypothetical protein